MRFHRYLPLFPALALLGLASSCDRSVRDNSTSSESALVQLAPRILLDNGMPVIPVESVRMVVTLDGKAHFDTTVDFGLKRLSAVGIPVGAKWALSVYGLRKPTNGRRLVVWWKGSKSGTAEANPGHVDWDTTFVTVQDTTGPELTSNYGFPESSVITYRTGEMTETRKLQFQAMKTDSVFLSDSTYTKDSLIKGSDNGGQFLQYVVNFDFSKAPSRTFYIKVVDSAGCTSTRKLTYKLGSDTPLPITDTTHPTIAFVNPSRDTTFFTSPDSFEVEVSPSFKGSDSGIDSVAIQGRTLQDKPWKTRVALTPGENTISATAFANSGLRGSVIRAITLPKLKGSDTIAPVVARSTGMPNPGDTMTVPWRTSSVNLAWTITDATKLAVTLDGEAFTSSSVNTWTTSRQLAFGLNEFRLLAKDTLGNSSTDTLRVRRLKDTTHPVVKRGDAMAATVPLPFPTDSFVVSWTVSDSDTVLSVTIAGDIATHRDDTWSRTILLPRKLAGSDTTIVIEAKDRWGTTTRDSVVLHVAPDDIAPTLARSSNTHNDDVAYNTPSFTAEWTVRDPGGIEWVKINDAVVTSTDSTFKKTISLANKITVIRIESRDSAGNSRKDSISITRKPESGDNTPPTIHRAIGMPTDKETTVPWITKVYTFRWILSDDGKVASAFLKGDSLRRSGDTGSITLPLRVGRDTLALEATDTAGNKAFDTLFLTRQADTSHPVLNGSRSLTYPFGTRGSTTAWTITDLDSITKVTLNGRVQPEFDSITVNFRKARDGYDTAVYIEATDRAGNTSGDSIRFELRPDTIAPVAKLVKTTACDTTFPIKPSTCVLYWEISDNDSLSTVAVNGKAAPKAGGYYTIDRYSASVWPAQYSDSVIVILKATDMKNNTATDSFCLRWPKKTKTDSIAPTVYRKRPLVKYDTANVSKTSYDLAWTVTDAHLDSSKVTVNGNRALYYSQESFKEWAYSGPLTQDTNRFIMTAWDSSGNHTSDTVYIVRTGATSVNETAQGWASQGVGTNGGAGGRIDTVRTLAELQTKAIMDGAMIIFVDGQNGTFGEFLDYASTPPKINVTSNKTIVGFPATTVYGAFVLKGSNIILRNLSIQGPGGNPTLSAPADAIEIAGVSNIWIDHCYITDAQGNSIAIKDRADLVTITRTRFINSTTDTAGRSWNGILIGDSTTSSGDQGKLRVTLYQNIWGVQVRKPITSVRYGKVHVINNVFSGSQSNSTSPAILAGLYANLLVEENWFTSYTNGSVGIHPTATDQSVKMTADNFIPSGDKTIVLKDADNVVNPSYPTLPTLDPTNLDNLLKNSGNGATIQGWKF